MMSKSNNKGISLIDVLIAVAVMSILISPIIAQIITTVDTSSRAKERQYVIDDADLVMDYFRSNSITELSQTGDKGDAVIISDSHEWKKQSATVLTIEDPSFYSEDPIEYNYREFDLSSKDKAGNIIPYEILGRENNHYERSVILDDLNNVVLSEGLEINYEFNSEKYNKADPGSYGDKFVKIKDKVLELGFEITTEGSAVKYNDEGHIVAVVTKKHDSDGDGTADPYTNPNKSTPIITDIDSEKMAIIEGDASSIDNQFQNDFIGNLMTIVAKNKSTLEKEPYNEVISQYEYYLDKDNLNKAFDKARADNEFHRMIKLTVVGEDVVADKPSHYRVKCEVFYKTEYIFLGTEFSTDADNEKFRYTVFDRTFNTSEPPDVFFVYEPFVKKTDADYNSYADVEYIAVKSDKYTSGVAKDADGKTYDPSKIYLIKADSTWAEEVVNTINNGGVKRTSEEIAEDKKSNDKDPLKYYNYFYYVKNGTNVPVELNINQISDTLDSSALPLQIITNISWRPNDDTATTLDKDNPILNNPVGADRQFTMDVLTDSKKPDEGLSATEKLVKYPYKDSTVSKIDKIKYASDSGIEDRYAIDCPTSDTVEYGRLYTITVRYNNLSKANENHTGKKNDKGEYVNPAYIYFTGAKGAD